MKKFIAYYRVSTQRQADSGLGLDAQVSAVSAYVRSQGGEIVKEYQEVETGKRADRPELLKAIAHCKRSKATLVIAKLDRLARNMKFTATLMDSTVEFVACDNPNANRLTIHILAAVAENEAKMISDRTKAALAAFTTNKWVPKRLRDMHPEGVPVDLAAMYAGKLGSSRPDAYHLTVANARKGAAVSAQVSRTLAAEAYSDITPLVRELKAEGLSLRQIAAKLDAEGMTTRTGKPWNQVQVMRLLRAA